MTEGIGQRSTKLGKLETSRTMSDQSKAEKLANARKKFLELKKEKEKELQESQVLSTYFTSDNDNSQDLQPVTVPTFYDNITVDNVTRTDQAWDYPELKGNEIHQHILQNNGDNSHLQTTIGILIAEKTELNTTVKQLQSTSKRQTDEIEELQNRLKASRFRVGDLERELTVLKQFNNAQDFELKYKKLEQDKLDLEQEHAQVSEKCKSVVDRNLDLETQLTDSSKQLELAQLKIQQLVSTDTVENENIPNTVDTTRINELEKRLETVQKEHTEAELQYKQYIQQLHTQNDLLGKQLDNLRQQYNSLLAQEENRVRHIEDLEKQLQQGSLRHDLDSALELAEKLQLEKQDILNANHMLTTQIEDLKSTQLDHVKLTEAMESDKVAASRAMTQNLELKKQLDSMEEVLSKLDMDKVKLTEELEAEQQINREIDEKLARSDHQLKTLTEALEIKDRQLTTYIGTETDLNAMKSLEMKLVRTMDDIARLTEEKQRLEHLVLQLQHETETIGEYVALYQHQRGILKQKAHEKELQLSQLDEDRLLIQAKLDQLVDMIKTPGASKENLIEVLTDIKDSNLIRPTEELHHCPWCSGQLITV